MSSGYSHFFLFQILMAITRSVHKYAKRLKYYTMTGLERRQVGETMNIITKELLTRCICNALKLGTMELIVMLNVHICASYERSKCSMDGLMYSVHRRTQTPTITFNLEFLHAYLWPCVRSVCCKPQVQTSP